MKKFKVFVSFLKERDWLEEMARNGWVLTDIKLGMWYYFKEAEPSEKVYEIEHFGAYKKPSVKELTARKFAVDIAEQAGWEIVTHDEDMNYYFMKDKAGDETDELYDDEELRRDRGERYRNRYHDMGMSLLKGVLGISVLYAFLFFVFRNSERLPIFTWIYVSFVLIETLIINVQKKWGDDLYKELILSREEWENKKKYSENCKFNKVGELKNYLLEKSQKGLAIVSGEQNTYMFEENDTEYDYYIDNYRSFKKRMKKQQTKFESDKKDWIGQSLKWYEMSMEEAEKKGLKLVCAVNKDNLIYRCPKGEALIDWDNDNESLKETDKWAAIMVVLFVVAFIGGFIGGFLKAKYGL